MLWSFKAWQRHFPPARTFTACICDIASCCKIAFMSALPQELHEWHKGVCSTVYKDLAFRVSRQLLLPIACEKVREMGIFKYTESRSLNSKRGFSTNIEKNHTINVLGLCRRWAADGRRWQAADLQAAYGVCWAADGNCATGRTTIHNARHCFSLRTFEQLSFVVKLQAHPLKFCPLRIEACTLSTNPCTLNVGPLATSTRLLAAHAGLAFIGMMGCR